MPQKTTCIIPAYNEGLNIHRVLIPLQIALEKNIIDEIIVVDDGSRDHTTEIALTYKAKVISFIKNRGKAFAMKEGLNEASGEICVFLDADLLALKPYHLAKLIEPVQKKIDTMTVAKFKNGRFPTDLSHEFNIKYSGQRAGSKDFFLKIFLPLKRIKQIKYGIENIITERSKNINIDQKIVEWQGVGHVLKEEKWGLIGGFYARIKMYIQIILGHFRNIKYNLSENFAKEKTSD